MVVHAAGARAEILTASDSARCTVCAASALSGARWYSAGSAVMKAIFSSAGSDASTARRGASVSAMRPSTISTCSS